MRKICTNHRGHENTHALFVARSDSKYTVSVTESRISYNQHDGDSVGSWSERFQLSIRPVPGAPVFSVLLTTETIKQSASGVYHHSMILPADFWWNLLLDSIQNDPTAPLLHLEEVQGLVLEELSSLTNSCNQASATYLHSMKTMGTLYS